MTRWSDDRWQQNEDGSYTRRALEPESEPSAYDDMTKDELQAELENRGLPTSGNKPDLIARLQESDG